MQETLPHLIQAPSANGGTYQFTFTQTGVYTYHCSIHPQMTGTVTVQ